MHTQRTLTTHALRPGRAHSTVSWRTGRRVAARTGRAAAMLPSPPGHDTKNCITTQSLSRALRVVSRALPHVSQRSCAVSQGAATPYRSLAASYCDTKGHPQPRYKICIATHPQRPSHARARSAARPAPRQVVSQGLLAISWPCRSPTTTCRGVPLHAPASRVS